MTPTDPAESPADREETERERLRDLLRGAP
jgi:hypothetical protein